MIERFGYIDELVPGIRWDAKYATWDNFTGRPVDGYLVNRIIGTRELCLALTQAREEAAVLGFGLLLWDGYRPQRAVDAFLRWSREPEPQDGHEDGQGKRRHYPAISRPEMFERGYVATKSGHSRGSTLDLTLFDLASGDLVDMGGDHDLMDEISHHGAAGITPAQTRNREQLCTVMEASGFGRYDSEWWHYSLVEEPYPDTYFDFPVD
ncbi:D-alanyl-D-alanine dipeptidase [Nocardioides albertanoniae]|uniref:D-alanyl-D-alanine dipeptidase n=1 Tax=Nocardioides albertanoniae TaxID=1175486 RepID=A0A543A8X0_9ACTN|nr:D-Ala-D-Ala dipeptidase VanX [Nocardioides albertanoniae]TQL69042.1 D-alanyl-D-alanine dipeptidase [Nocardioides albertanoniae]